MTPDLIAQLQGPAGFLVGSVLVNAWLAKLYIAEKKAHDSTRTEMVGWLREKEEQYYQEVRKYLDRRSGEGEG